MVNVNCLTTAAKLIKRGNAILLLGAGFGSQVFREDGECLPSGPALADAMTEHFDLGAGYPLDKAAGYFLQKSASPDALRRFLMKRLVVDSVSESAKIIASAPWRRVYTTNYDLGFERARQDALGVETYRSYPPASQPADIEPNALPVVHIHGLLDIRSPEKFDNQLLLTRKAYLDNTFRKQKWFQYFLHDIQTAECIIIAGQSMNDLHIAELFTADPATKRKTVCIAKRGVDPVLALDLQNIGTVISDGFEGLAASIASTPDSIKFTSADLLSFEQNTWREPQSPASTDDFIDLIVLGHFDEGVYCSTPDKYVISRNVVQQVEAAIRQERRFINIFSGIGNGKSISSRILGLQFAKNGYLSFSHVKNLPGTFDEIDTIKDIIAKSEKRAVVIFDDINTTTETARIAIERLPTNTIFIGTTRSFIYEADSGIISDVFFESQLDINAEKLTSGEVSALEFTIDHYGLWGELSNVTRQERIDWITKECGSDLSAVILYLYKHSTVAEKINDWSKSVIESSGDLKRALAALMIFNITRTAVNTSELCDFSGVATDTFTRAPKNLSELVDSRNLSPKFRSPILAEYLLQSSISTEYMIETIKTLISHFNDNNSNERYYKDIVRNLVRFGSISRIFNNDNLLIARFYDSLKEYEICSSNPQFWLQYALVEIENTRFDRAERYLARSYSEARKLRSYSTFMIDNQMARFLLLSRAYDKGRSDIVPAALKAKDMIVEQIREPNRSLRYPYRAAASFEQLVEQRARDISSAEAQLLLGLVNTILTMSEADRQHAATRREVEDARRGMLNAKQILEKRTL